MEPAVTLTRQVGRGITAASIVAASLLAAVAGCSSSVPTAAHLNSAVTPAPTSSAAVIPAPTSTATGTSSGVSQSCSSQGGLTVCPGTAAPGDTVSITSETSCGAGASGQPILMFLGPLASVGPGGGDEVATTPTRTGFSASYQIPSSYAGSEQSGTSGLTLPVAPGSVFLFSTDPASACSVPFTVAPTTSGKAGVFADTWQFHVTGLSIGPDGDGAVTWRDSSLCGTTAGCYGATAATFVLSDVTGTTAQAVIQASNDPGQLPVGTSLTLTLEPHDTLSVSGVPAGSPFYNTPLCGSQAAALTVAQQSAEGISCGA
jgi:hypothetical protein